MNMTSNLSRLQFLGKTIEIMGLSLLVLACVFAFDNLTVTIQGVFAHMVLYVYFMSLCVRRLRDVAQGYSAWISFLVFMVVGALTGGIATVLLFVMPTATFVKKTSIQ